MRPARSGAPRVRRESLLEVRPEQPMATRVSGWAHDDVLAPSAQRVAECAVRLATEVDGRVSELDAGPLTPVLSPLVGVQSGSGFRRRLAALPADSADLRLLVQLLDDLPIVTRVGMQTLLLDHPAVPAPTLRTSTAGADQCEGWRSDGTLVQTIRSRDGLLSMALSEPVDDRTGPWATSPVPALPPMATRRRRRVEVTPDGDGVLSVEAHFRDSYADPDGVERGLHGYAVTLSVDADGTVREAGATGVVLPYAECWAAAGSPERLVGRSLSDVDAMSKQELFGRGTCTHLTDTLRTLRTAVGLAGLLPA
jgi:hypothetical protein